MQTRPSRQTWLLGLEEEIAAVAARARTGLVELLTIVGQPGAGKTTLASEIAARLGATKVEQDTFLWEAYRRRGESLFDKYDDESLEMALEALIGSRPFGYEPFDVQDRKRQGWSVLEPSPLIVLEGVIALHNSYVRHRSALTIFVDAETELREARQLDRINNGGWYNGASIEEQRKKILAKRTGEAPIIGQQLGYCRWLVDTTAQPSKVERLHQADERALTLS